jgi:hypothetical protein
MNRILPTTLVALVCVGWAMADAKRTVEGQATPKRSPLMLVTWFGPGSIPLPVGDEWKPEQLTVYDNGKRPVAQFSDEQHKMGMSLLLFENRSGTPSPHGCREDTLSPIVKKYGKVISKRFDKDSKLADGTEVATTSYLLDMGDGKTSGLQRNLFGFVGNATTCAEVHISSVVNTPAEGALMQQALSEFHPNLAYQPAAIDLFHIGQLLFKSSPSFAAPYFKASLAAMPGDASFTTPRRLATDQLVMALGKSGDVKGSREVAEKAAVSDPYYPMNYYNLACADAEEGDAANARKHLQAAYDRRKFVLEGEHMPDASKDDSLLKLKSDAAFWEFVMSLPKS